MLLKREIIQQLERKNTRSNEGSQEWPGKGERGREKFVGFTVVTGVLQEASIPRFPFPQSFLSRCAATTRLLTGHADTVYIFLRSLVYMDLSLLPSRLQLLHPKPGAATSSPAPYPGRLLSSALSWARLCPVQ